jgi:hypothetical protein
LVIASGALDVAATTTICRQQGLLPHHFAQWKADFANVAKRASAAKQNPWVKTFEHEIKTLNRELNLKGLVFAEAATVVVKKCSSYLGQRRGRLTLIEQRQALISLVGEALLSGARQSKVCALLGIRPLMLQRWAQPDNIEDRRHEPTLEARNKLSELERQRVLKNSHEAK